MKDKGILNQTRFDKYLLKYAIEIKKYSFDEYQIKDLISIISVIMEHNIKLEGKKPIEDVNLTYEALMEFRLALLVAYSNYRQEKKSLWARIFHRTIPELPKMFNRLK